MSSLNIGFIVVAIVLIGCAVALVATPLLRGRVGEGNAPIAATITAVSLPALAVLMYVLVSNHDWAAPQQQAPAASGPAGTMPEVVMQLEQRLAESPDDVEGWLLLGRSYMQMQRYTDARRAFVTAFELEPSNNAKLAIAEVDIMQDRANLGGDAGRMIEEVLAEEPDDPRALFYGGMVAMLRGDTELLRERWQKLLGMSPPDNIRQIMEQQLAQFDPSTGSGSPSVTESSTGADDNGISIDVSLSDELAARAEEGAILFVLARQPGVSGPPIAAIRATASQLPASLRISDADAMLPGRSLAGLDTVELVARVSNGGDPIATSGDLFGQVIWTDGNDTDRSVAIVIDQVVE